MKLEELPTPLFKVGDIITTDCPVDKYELYEVTEVSDECNKYYGYKYTAVPANDHTKKLRDTDDGFEFHGFEGQGQPDDCGFELADLDALGFIPFREVEK